MQHTLHKRSDVQDEMAARTTKESSDPIFGTEEMQNVVQQNQATAPVEEEMKSSVENSCLADLEGLIFESAPDSDHGTDGELDLDAWGGALAECVCEMVCVCHGPPCKCSDGCICD
jgi:hypothetical protein